MKTITTVSFFDVPRDSEDVWSGAVYQPKGYDFPKAQWMDIRPGGDKWIRPREFMHWAQPEQGYLLALFDLYDFRLESTEWGDPAVWLHNVVQGGDKVACWCPNERAARRQIEEFGSYICHLSVVKAWVEERLPGIVEWVDERPDRYKFRS